MLSRLTGQRPLDFPSMAALVQSAAFLHATTLSWLIIGFGVTVRCVQYLAHRSLWLDEVSLALNIVPRTFPQLLKPLDYEQGAPLGFLMVEKTIVHMFGSSEYALRFFPLLSGIVSLFIFYAMVKLLLTPEASIIALVLFSFSD